MRFSGFINRGGGFSGKWKKEQEVQITSKEFALQADGGSKVRMGELG